MENESALRRNEIRTHVTARMSFTNVTFSLNFILRMGILPAYVSMYHMHAVPTEVRRECWSPWNWS